MENITRKNCISTENNVKIICLGKKNIKSKILLVTAVMGMSTILSACGRKNVDYGSNGESAVDNKTNQTDTSNQDYSDTADSGSLTDRLGVPESCTMDFDTGDTDLRKISLVDDNIEVPDTDHMSVVYVTKNDNLKEYKQKIAEALFDLDKGITSSDSEVKTKAELQSMLDSAREDRKQYQTEMENEEDEDRRFMLEGELDYYDEYINDLEQQIQEAPDEVADTYSYEADTYVGTIGDYEYTLRFGYGEADTYWNLRMNNDVCEYRPAYDSYDASVSAYSEDEISDIKEAVSSEENKCDLNENQALSMAEDYLDDFGITDTVLTETSELYWTYSDSEGQQHIDKDGYSFTFRREVDGQPVNNLNINEVDNICQNNVYVPVEEYEIRLDCQGYLNISCNGFFQMTDKEDENVSLLSFRDMLEKADENISEYYKKYDTKYGTVEFNNICLTYYPVADEETENTYMYIPVWILSQSEADDYYSKTYPQQMVVINAMDGSVIDLTENAVNMGACYEAGE